jgi:hypothetical protein
MPLCNICLKRLPTPFGMKLHMQRMHPKKEPQREMIVDMFPQTKVEVVETSFSNGMDHIKEGLRKITERRDHVSAEIRRLEALRLEETVLDHQIDVLSKFIGTEKEKIMTKTEKHLTASSKSE